MCVFSYARSCWDMVFPLYCSTCHLQLVRIFWSKKNVRLFALLLLTPLLLFSAEKGKYAPKDLNTKDGFDPWYQGVLIATSASNVLPGDLCIQPYLTFTAQYGTYQNNWSMKKLDPPKYTLSPSLFLEWGITDWLDFNMLPTMFTKWRGGTSSTHLADTFTALGFQLLNDHKKSPTPDIRLVAICTFPTGRFEEADVPQFVTDFSGAGAVEYGLLLAVAKKIFHDKDHPWRVTTNLGYTRSTPVKVDGFSVYGGGINAQGTVQPGSSAVFNLVFEYSVTQSFALACENIFHWVGETTFTGFDGGRPVGSPSSFLCTFCPEIEYSFTANQGFIAGLWWHYAGKNSPAFIAPILSYCYTY